VSYGPTGSPFYILKFFCFEKIDTLTLNRGTRMQRLIIALLVLVISTPTMADKRQTLGEVLEMHKINPLVSELIVANQEVGMGWANRANTAKGYPPHYCRPPKLGLTISQVFDIFKRYVIRKKLQTENTNLMGSHLLSALEEVFPCPKQ
jgi:hypothetical protein